AGCDPGCGGHDDHWWCQVAHGRRLRIVAYHLPAPLPGAEELLGQREPAVAGSVGHPQPRGEPDRLTGPGQPIVQLPVLRPGKVLVEPTDLGQRRTSEHPEIHTVRGTSLTTNVIAPATEAHPRPVGVCDGLLERRVALGMHHPAD